MSEAAFRLVLVALAAAAASSSSAYVVNAEEGTVQHAPTTSTAATTWECPNVTSAANDSSLECSCELAHALRCTGNLLEALQALRAHLRRTGPRISLLDVTLSGVSVLPASFLEDKQGSLHGLVVSTGELRRVHEAAFASFSGSLRALGLPNNQLEAVPTSALSRLVGLERLDLSHNRLETLEATSFRGMGDLNYLDLSYNLLAQLSPQAFASLSGLRSLKMRGNRLRVSTLSAIRGLRSLEELDVSVNMLSGPVGAGFLPPMQRLSFLSIAENELKSVQQGALVGLKNLSTLVLSHNQIDVISDHAFRHLTTLTRLELAYNDIVAVSSASLGHLDKLLSLDLSKNFLRSLSADLVVPLRSLEALKLDDNDITMVTSDLPTSKLRLRSLSLANNPLNCDCSLVDFASWLANSTQLTDSDRRSAVCATPPALENALLAELPATSLLCGDPPGRRPPLHQRSPASNRSSGQLSLAEFHYDEATGVDLLWRVDSCAQRRYTCDTLTVYEATEPADEEVQVSSSPIHCDSRLMPQPCTLPVSLPASPFLRSGRRYRFCVVLMLPGGYDDHSGHGCSDLIELEDSVHLVAQLENEPRLLLEPRISAVHVNLSADGQLQVEVALSGDEAPSAECAVELDVFATQSGQVHRKRVNCSSSGATTRTTLTGLAPGRYRVCANLMSNGESALRNGRARCVEVQAVRQPVVSDARTTTTTTTTTATLLFVLLLLMLLLGVGVLGFGRCYSLLGRAKKVAPPQFAHQQLEITHKAHYIKLLATTKV
ncbi:slit homolog 1 protein-like [Copidosoma floridanum]|uniref:slit homolog 1 protein-like n=1 Tax=Copidosoma floridanum TaxID=29053 RepID=UPI000C6F5825|nr:slit homolog 1 protein-like [Copidosoma floridanum]